MRLQLDATIAFYSPTRMAGSQFRMTKRPPSHFNTGRLVTVTTPDALCELN